MRSRRAKRPQDSQRRRDAEVVVERRTERLASRGEGVGERDVVGAILAVGSQRPDERVEAFDSGCRGAEGRIGVIESDPVVD